VRFRVLRCAWRHLAYYWGRTAILAGAVALTVVLPVAIEVFVRLHASSVTARAASTPLLLGAKGSRFDLVLANLYYRGQVPDAVAMAQVAEIAATGYADPIPIYAAHQAGGYAVVGTVPEYFAFRQLRCRQGHLPLRLGDAVIGHEVAVRSALQPGDTLLTERAHTFDLAAGYPLRLNVVGVLAPAGSPDDFGLRGAGRREDGLDRGRHRPWARRCRAPGGGARDPARR
jgi:putative ABC transport system permease protein